MRGPHTLYLTTPTGQAQEIPIYSSSTCNPNNSTNEPDFIATRSLTHPGTYTVTLNGDADSEKSTFTISPKTPPLTFERYSPSRLSLTLKDRYPMVITLTAHESFQGTITDTLPSSHEFVWYGDARIFESEKSKTISWDVNLQAGSTLELKYDYSPTSSGTTHIGPLLAQNNPQENTLWHQVITLASN